MALTKITSDVIETGAITSDKLASGAVSASSLSSITTDNVSEGSTNTYFTNARARGSVSVTGGGLSYDSGTGVIQIGSIPNASLTNSSLTVNSNSVSLGGSVTLDTDDIGEGSTNLYFTNARAQGAISGGTGVTVSGGAISIGQDVATSSTPTFGNITTTGYIAGPATFTIDPAAVGNNTGTVVIAGNLQVDGTTTTINSTTMEVDDLNITLASGAANAAAANGAGITVDCGSDTDATFTYDGTNDEWDFNKDINVTGTITSSGNITGTLATAAQPNITSLGTITGLTSSGTISINSSTSYGNLELGGADGGFIDFKTPFSDDKDARIIYQGTNFQISTHVDQPILIKHNTVTVLETSSSGIEITGSISVTGDITLTETQKIQSSESSGGSHLLLRDDNLGVTSNSMSLIGLNDILIGAKSNNSGTGNIYFGVGAENKASGSGWTDTLTILEGGNVGIGETNPNRKLNLLNQSGNTLMKIQTNAEGYAGIDYANSAQLWYAGLRTDVGNSWAIKDETNTNVFFQVRPSSGKVGIGLNTDTPRKVLHVKGNESNAQVVEIEQDNNAGIAGMHFSFNDTTVAHLGMAGASYTGNSEWTDKFFIGTISDKAVVISQNDIAAMTIDTDQNVIIGSGHNSTTPSHAIIKAAAASGFNNTGGDLRLYGGTSTGDNAGGEIEFYTGAAASSGTQANTPTRRMTIDSSGNVGIGLSNPSDYYSNSLVVSATAEKGITIAATGISMANYLAFADGTTGDQRYRGYISYNHSGDNMVFATAGTEKLIIDSSGRVGIGQTNPGVKLEIGENNSSSNVGYIRLRGHNTLEGNIYKTSTYGLHFDTNSNNQPIRIDGSKQILGITGNVGIGTESPSSSAKLDVNGVLALKGNDFLDSDTSAHYIKAPTSLYFYTNATNIALELQPNMLAKFLKLSSRVASFGQSDANDKYITFYNSSGNFDIGTHTSNRHYLYGNGDIPISVFTNQVERVTIDDKGIKQYNRFVSGTILPTAFVGCDSWYDLSGRYSTVVTSGNDLTSCTDASGEGRSTLIKNTAATGPNNNASLEQFPSGIYGFRFDRASYITGTSHTSGYVPPSGTNPRTLWCIIYNFQEIAGEPINHFLHYGTSITGQAFGIVFTPTSNEFGQHTWGGSGQEVDADTDIAGGFTNNGTTPRDVYVLFSSYDGGTGETRVYRGGMEGVSAIGSVSINTGAGYALHVGSRIAADNSDESCDAVIGEFGAFSRRLTTKEMDLMASSLLLRWS